jgi:predicted dehydrogenase
MLSDPMIDVVYISLPNHLHEEWVLESLRNGKHVLCEKPLGLNSSSVELMLKVAEESRLLVFENLMYLQHPLHSAVKQIIGDGKIGRIISLRCVFRFPFPLPGNIKLDKDGGGGAFHDLNRYPLSSALSFLKGKTFQILDVTTTEKGGLNLSMDASVCTEEDEQFSFSIGFGFPYESYYEITGECGVIRVNRAYTIPSELIGRVEVICDGADDSFDVAPADHFQLTIDHVCKLISLKNGYKCVHDGSRRLAKLAELFTNSCSGGV